MKASKPTTTTSLVFLLAGLGLVACGGAEGLAPGEAESAALSADPAPREAKRAEGEPAKGRQRRHPGPPHFDKMLERFDADGNGTLEARELPERLQARVGEIDSNGDAIVSKDELTAHMKARFLVHAKERFERKDANKDGVLDQSEVGEHWAKLSVADRDGDAKLTPEELRTAFEAGELAPPRHPHGKRGPREAPTERPATP